MWRNLRAEGDPESVHLTPYPEPDAGLIDEQLSTDMNALLRLVSLALSARNAAKIKVRQPLAELRVQPGSEADRRAVERFRDLLLDELNVKAVTLHDPEEGNLLLTVVKPNMKTLGEKFKARLKEVQKTITDA